MKQRIFDNIQSSVLRTTGLRRVYTTVNFNVTPLDEGYEYDSVTITTQVPFTKENFDVVRMTVDAALSDGSEIPASSVVEIADLFGVDKASSEVMESIRKVLADSITKYDVSENVNEFFVNGQSMWLDKATRVGLVNSLRVQKESGLERSTLWFGGIGHEVSIDDALSFLSRLELYAIECYNVTQRHLAEIKALETLEDILAYDFTEGYPPKIEVNF